MYFFISFLTGIIIFFAFQYFPYTSVLATFILIGIFLIGKRFLLVPILLIGIFFAYLRNEPVQEITYTNEPLLAHGIFESLPLETSTGSFLQTYAIKSVFKEQRREEISKGQEVRKKIVQLAENKFLFKVVECMSPVSAIVKDGRVGGLVMMKNKIEKGRALPVPGTDKEILSPLVISSIGSVPAKIDGIKQLGEQFNIENPETGKLKDYDNVFILWSWFCSWTCRTQKNNTNLCVCWHLCLIVYFRPYCRCFLLLNLLQ